MEERQVPCCRPKNFWDFTINLLQVICVLGICALLAQCAKPGIVWPTTYKPEAEKP